MSKIIKYNDFIQINPDKKILTLDKQEKIVMTDNLLNSAYSKGKGLIVTYDLSHSGRKINNRIYSTKGQQRGIESLVSPYPKPILKNHDQSSEPIGRFIGGQWEDLYEDAIGFFGAADQVLDIRNAFIRDEPGEIYSVMKKNGLIQNKRWPGLGRMRVQANITDEDAIRKFMDGRYITFSAGSTTDRHVCSICETDWAMDGMCEHRHGQNYDGETCVFITGDFIVLEGSVVNTPADDLSQVVSMEISDSLNIEQQDKKDIPYELIMSDSLIQEWRKEDGLQTTEQIDAYSKETNEKEEKPKEKVEKKYDHEMSISEKAMMELHEQGETYITQRGDGETMVIKVKYSGSMRKDSLDFEMFETELDEFAEELNDEKMFKVPAGAKGNAQKVLNWKKEKGSEVKGMTPVGWARARQLATKSEIGLSTVKRMAAFNRHRKNAVVAPEYKSEPWKDRGYVAWLGWGGTSGIDWAVKISAANDSELEEMMIGDFDLDAERSSPKGKGAKTPAKPSERIKGSKKNAEGSASKANSKIEVGSVLESLKEKVSSHNKKYGKEAGKRVTLGMLKAVYRRGAGAFSTTHRPGMSRSGWGVARVNAFLKLVRSGRPSNSKYKQDNDLLPSGHPRKSSNKMTKQKDSNMSENNITEDLDLEIELEEDSDKDLDLEIEAVEPTESQQKEHDESFSEEETLDAEDSIDVDWEFLDLALQGALIQNDAQLSTEARNNLPDSAFCGPERSFPVPDCAHVTAARRLIERSKYSDSVKKKIMSCVDKKAESFKCDKSDDFLALEKRFEELQASYNDLETKFKETLEALVFKQEKDNNIDEEKNIDNKLEENVELTDNKVENPSEHAIEDDNVVNKKQESILDSFEQSIVDNYKKIKESNGQYAADSWFSTQAHYLPRGFNPENF